MGLWEVRWLWTLPLIPPRKGERGDRLDVGVLVSLPLAGR
jgi:hypothetical protein